MEDTYRARVCPVCGGVVKCDLSSTPNQEDDSFRVVFVAECCGCGLSVAGNQSSVFKLFLDRAPTKIVQEAYYNKDDKWVYQTATYRGTN